jgi:hypothetical protein
MTDEEKQIMNKLIDAHNLYNKLPSTHPSDMQEWVNAIHQLQQLLGMRILRREHSDIFPIKSIN